MATDRLKGQLTGSLEDYLETIYLLLQERRVARVRDIAKARGVKAGSVTPALKRLAELELIDYEQREYIDLTPAGEQAARRVFARHQLLTRFFHEVLEMSAEAADAEACKLEHSLSNEGMDRLARFLEFLAICPGRPPELLGAFHGCSLVHSQQSSCDPDCPLLKPRVADAAPAVRSIEAAADRPRRAGASRSGRPSVAVEHDTVLGLGPGQSGEVAHVSASGNVRQRLLDMGLLPGVRVEVVRVGPSGSPVWIKIHGTEVALRKAEAESVHIASE
jgi:DtxR family Mn-dependent transcriptional regulator